MVFAEVLRVYARIYKRIQVKIKKIFEGASPFCRVSLAVYTAEHI